MTKRGRDYLKASIILTISSAILDVRITLALALSLMVAALVSQLILASASTKNLAIEIEHPRLSVFKGESVSERVKIVSKRRRFLDVQIDSIVGPEGVDASIESDSEDSILFSFKPNYAGRFQGIAITFALGDPLALFQKKMSVQRLGFVIDSFPRSLLLEPRLARPSSLSLGERTGRTSGHGQEFYAVDDYRPSSEKRSIYWKKVASRPDDKLVIKVRESNIPKTMKIGFVSVAERVEEDSLLFMDIACEGVALIGTLLQSIGCDIVIMHRRDGSVVYFRASDLSELSHGIMEMSSSKKGDLEGAFSIMMESDICVSGLKDLENKQFAEAITKKPALIVSELEANPWSIGDLAVVFSGNEDIGRIVSEVVGK